MTRTWASVPGPAPIPIVGISSICVISAPRSVGTPSSTIANAPAFSSACASSISRTESSPRPCTR